MGVVYRARHLIWNEEKALKVLVTGGAPGQPGLKGLMAEALVMRQLQHPHIVRVEDADYTEDNQPFVVMEYIDGQSLRQRLNAAGELVPELALRIAAQASSALLAAHQKGIIHRDIKPQNILLAKATDGSDMVKVIDFGIAKVREEVGLGFTGMMTGTTGLFVGTPEYASPEQAQGMLGSDLDGRTDLYSLGLVLYEMLTGRLPFAANTPVGVLVQRIQVQPVPPDWLRPELGIPPGVSKLVMKAIEKDREKRYQSAEEMERAIADLSHDVQVPRAEATKLVAVQSVERPERLPITPDRDRKNRRTITARKGGVFRRKPLAYSAVTGVLIFAAAAGFLWRYITGKSDQEVRLQTSGPSVPTAEHPQPKADSPPVATPGAPPLQSKAVSVPPHGPTAVMRRAEAKTGNLAPAATRSAIPPPTVSVAGAASEPATESQLRPKTESSTPTVAHGDPPPKTATDRLTDPKPESSTRQGNPAQPNLPTGAEPVPVPESPTAGTKDRETAAATERIEPPPPTIPAPSVVSGPTTGGLSEVPHPYHSAGVVVRVDPPRPVVEARVAAPGPGYVWVAGYHRWDGAAYVWVPGRWVRPPRPGAQWVAHHWVRRHGGWVLVEGHWR